MQNLADIPKLEFICADRTSGEPIMNAAVAAAIAYTILISIPKM